MSNASSVAEAEAVIQVKEKEISNNNDFDATAKGDESCVISGANLEDVSWFNDSDENAVNKSAQGKMSIETMAEVLFGSWDVYQQIRCVFISENKKTHSTVQQQEAQDKSDEIEKLHKEAEEKEEKWSTCSAVLIAPRRLFLPASHALLLMIYILKFCFSNQ